MFPQTFILFIIFSNQKHSHNKCIIDFLSMLSLQENEARGLLTLLAGVRFCCHLDVIGGQQACDPVGFSFPPVRVGLVQNADQLTLGEAQLILIGSSVVIHSDNLAHWEIRGDIWSLTY